VISDKEARGAFAYVRGMTRFFFHLDAAEWTSDEEGLDLASPAVAKSEAIRYAREIAGSNAADGVLDLDHAVEVHDTSGELVTRVAFANVVRL
jgi:hypothetical protein